MSFDYRFEPPHFKDTFNEPEEELFVEYEPYNVEDEFQDRIEEHLCEERHQNCIIQKTYERSLQL